MTSSNWVFKSCSRPFNANTLKPRDCWRDIFCSKPHRNLLCTPIWSRHLDQSCSPSKIHSFCRWLWYMERFETIFEILDSAFLKKIGVKGGRWLKKWEFGKKKIFLIYKLFIRFNFVFMYYGQFPPKSSLKLRFVLFKPEKVSNAAGISNLRQVVTSSDLKRTKLNFRLLLGGNWP